MKKTLIYILAALLPCIASGQNAEGFGSGEVFNPFYKAERDSSKRNLKIPTEIRQWHIDELFGEVTPVNADTLQYMYQNWHQTEGMNGEYNTLGNMGSPRQSRIFFNRPGNTEYNFLAPYDYFVTRPNEMFFTNTKSPYTNLTYHTSGNRSDGDDRFRAFFTTNVGKKLGIGGMFDYLYGRGRYDNQSTALMNFALFSYYKGERYNYHFVANRYHMKLAENGGITNDDYIKRPEETDGSSSNFGPADIPVNFEKTWNRNETYTAYFTHNYNLGYYRKSLATESDSTDIKPEFISIARIMHTVEFATGKRQFRCYEQPIDFYADNFLRADSMEQYRNFSLTNRVGISLREGSKKWAFANITAYLSYKYNRYTMPDTIIFSKREYAHRYNEHTVAIGGVIESNLNKIFKYRIQGENAISGDDLGAFSLEGEGAANFKLWGKEAQVKLKAFIRNDRPSFYYRHFHSQHYWWDNDDLDKEFKSRIELSANIEKTRTRIKAGIENIKNYTYIANTPANNTPLSSLTVLQADENIKVFSATLNQSLKWRFINMDVEATYQHSSNEAVLPLPALNLYANLYLKFRIAKVLNTELGADVRYFTMYYAPDYSPELGQFTLQNPQERVKTGDYPIVSVYANFLLKQTRFYVKYQHLNEGSGNRNYFLVPHYPVNPAILWLGLSWNFYN